MKFSIRDFFSKCNQMRSFLRIWSYLLKKSLMENFIFDEVKEVCLGYCQTSVMKFIAKIVYDFQLIIVFVRKFHQNVWHGPQYVSDVVTRSQNALSSENISSQCLTEAYSEPCQISKMERYAKIVNGKQPLTILAKCFILDV